MLTALAEGAGAREALIQAGLDPDRGLAVLASLELDGYLRRGPGGRFDVMP
jgi:hypothetical protein